MISGKCARQILLLDTICANLSRTKGLLKKKTFWENVKYGSLFGYVECDIEEPESLQEAHPNSPPVFKNINVGRADIGPFMKGMPRKKDFQLSPGEG